MPGTVPSGVASSGGYADDAGGRRRHGVRLGGARRRDSRCPRTLSFGRCSVRPALDRRYQRFADILGAHVRWGGLPRFERREPLRVPDSLRRSLFPIGGHPHRILDRGARGLARSSTLRDRYGRDLARPHGRWRRALHLQLGEPRPTSGARRSRRRSCASRAHRARSWGLLRRPRRGPRSAPRDQPASRR